MSILPTAGKPHLRRVKFRISYFVVSISSFVYRSLDSAEGGGAFNNKFLRLVRPLRQAQDRLR